MIRYIAGLFFLVLLAQNIFPQEVTDYLDKIDLKLKRDKSYLNLNYVVSKPDSFVFRSLKAIPRQDHREAFSFRMADNVQYMFVFLNKVEGRDSIELLYVNEINSDTSSAKTFFGAVNGDKTDTLCVLNFRDLISLKWQRNPVYDSLYTFVKTLARKFEQDELPSLLGIKPDNEITTSFGISSPDNEDYLSYAKINSIHYYPENKTVSQRGGRGGEVTSSPLKLDLSFSTLSFAHEKMNFMSEGSSLEISAADNVLNLLPYQALSLKGGFRTLFNFSGGRDIKQASYLDARFMARFRANTSGLSTNSFFIVSNDRPVLNVGNSIILDLNFMRPFSLPFINLYMSMGQKKFSDPIVSFSTPVDKYAFFSFTQDELTMSFFWNASDKKTGRFKMDIGAAYFDVWTAHYDSLGNAKRTYLQNSVFNPVVALSYNFVPNNNPLLGGDLRFFDSRIKALFWLKIVELSPISTLRFETIYLSGPVARQNRIWENNGGVMFQLRYRYGL